MFRVLLICIGRNYTSMVHCFRINGDNIALDVNSNALHIVTDAAVDLIRALSMIDVQALFERAHDGPTCTVSQKRAAQDCFIGALSAAERRYGIEAANSAASDIVALIEDGQLFAPGADEPGDASGLAGTYVFKSLCLHLAHDCNMRCAYCFASEGSFGLGRELMGAETARAAIDFVTGASGGRKNIEIDFFGGEPLLNFDVLKRTVDYARSRERESGKRFRFTLTTNGLLLDDGAIRYVNDNMDNLVMSIDGRQAVNDRMRECLDGTGTYDIIVKNFHKAIRGRTGSWYVRGTYTALNKDFTNDVLHLADIGFDRISVEPVVSPIDPALEFSAGDADELEAEYEKLALALSERQIQGKPIDFFHFNVDLDSGPCLARRIKGCGAGYEYAAVAPNGDIYPCHQFVGAEGFRLGTVFDGIGGQTAAQKLELFKRTNIYSKEDCRACWARFFCGGGCAANAWHYNRDIEKPSAFYCRLFRKRIECALWLRCAPYIEKTRLA